MNYAILDCYTDEPSGLGVPPYLGTYPRYIYGYLKSNGITPKYITIDDLRLSVFYNDKIEEVSVKDKTNIRIHNLTKNNAPEVLSRAHILIIVLGVHAPGKYLTAIPGTMNEITRFLSDFSCKKILTGPGVFGTQLEGGKFSENTDIKGFVSRHFNFSYDEISKYSVLGAEILNQIPDKRIIEIETARGCNIGTCSFCTEPLKSGFHTRKTEAIVKEVKKFYDLGARYFRLGKQSDFYAIENPVLLLKSIRNKCPKIDVLHIDNVNPISVVKDKERNITKSIVKYCSPGNIAALGIESFDPEVIRLNTLNCSRDIAMKAIRIINEYGSERGKNGMPKFLPGINLLFGLMGESRQTHRHNFQRLIEILESGLILRRINIRQVSLLPGTRISEEAGNKYLRKNKKYYWKWRNEIRQKIDYPMLKRLVPSGTILKNVYSEIYDGKTTFARQFGTYPLIVGIKKRIPLKRFYDVEIKEHMLRSVVGEVRE